MQFVPNAAGDYANHRLVSTGDKEEFAPKLREVKFELASLEKKSMK